MWSPFRNRPHAAQPGNLPRHIRALRGRRKGLRLLLVMAALLSVLAYLDWARMGWYWLARQNHPEPASALASYTVSMEAQPVAGLVRNASGLTYSRASGMLFTVINRPAAVAELGTDGQLLRHVPLPWLGDPEGITHIRDDLFVISDESDNTLHRVRIPQASQPVENAGIVDVPLDFRHWPNLGLEGVSWDETEGQLLLANEKWPRKVLLVQGLALAGGPGAAANVQVQNWRPRAWLGFLGRDLASLTTHPASGNLLVLGEQSRLITEYSRRGDMVGVLPLRRGFAGLKKNIPQPEGIAMAPDGDIYILSEPNLLYRLERGRR